MRALVTGGNGLLGRALTAKLKKEGWQISAPSHQEMDITCQEQVEQVFREFRPEIVFHCAAYTQVDQAEKEQELCRKINAEGTRIIACCCGKQGVKLVYLSTDYVFPGEGSVFQKAEDPTGPLNVYGESKLEGERAVRDLGEVFYCPYVLAVWRKGRGISAEDPDSVEDTAGIKSSSRSGGLAHLCHGSGRNAGRDGTKRTVWDLSCHK